MGKINVLGFDVANLIAAGEVVDRPASVVKELCENSLDSGADSITVEIRHGGTSFIRVSDNGCGIEPDDLPLTVLRHATSKIATAEDLATIGTLGFRGEALAAISAVCKMKIMSRTKGAELGAVLDCEGGEIINVMETGCAGGTTVVCSELFYNVPARRKFLKKDATEGAAITAVIEKIAVSAPKVAVKYIMDGEVRFMTSGNGELRGAIYSVFGRDTASRMTAVDRTDTSGIRISGFIGEPDLVRSNKNSENFFINGRFIKSRTAMAALEQAYSTRMPAQKFPVCVLNISLNPAIVDVNVHPSKLEVKFANERLVFEAVYYAVLNALESNAPRPEFRIAAETARSPKPFAPQTKISAVRETDAGAKNVSSAVSDIKKSADGGDAFPGEYTPYKFTPPVKTVDTKRPPAHSAFVPVERSPEDNPEKAQIKIEKAVSASASAPEKREAPPEAVPDTAIIEPLAEKSEEIPEYIVIGEVYNTYVIVQLSDRILMIDKHAAHERILFDELCSRMKKREKKSQVLMFPLKIKLPEAELIALEDYGDSIRAVGFAFSVDKSEGIAAVTEIPDEIGRYAAEDMMSTLASGLSEGVGSVEAAEVKYFEAKLFQASCKAAIKGGRVYDSAHIKWICDRLLKIPGEDGAVIKTCPHGRPVAFEIKKNSIDRQFDRLM